ncbi:MAG: hypothetical protein AUH43_20350 [Acidobacteria bacterium 13_1_40CM_65_14]|nr:MAG: hypothetical protein AUH43_20350 [Acidobacteria bacterium 13_1_40CM_65_14]
MEGAFMSESLSSFLVDLASDPNQMARFLADPARVIDAASLSAEERAALLARDSVRLRGALGASLVEWKCGVAGGGRKGGGKKGGARKGGGKKGSSKGGGKKAGAKRR